MKRILLFLLLAFAGMTQAQIVNIPDANFKFYLLNPSGYYTKDLDGNYIILDANHDNEIQVSEALALGELVLAGSGFDVHSLEGIEAFTNLYSLNCSSNEINELNIGSLVNLRILKCRSNNITHLDLSGLDYLEEIDCAVNGLETLNVSGLMNLISLNCIYNSLTYIDLAGMENLEIFKCLKNNFNTLYLDDLVSLKEFECGQNEIINLNLSNSPNLEYIDVKNCSMLEYINLKNGSIILSPGECDFSNCPNLSFICLDQGEEIVLGEYIPISVNINTYCTFTPGGNYNVITGSLLFDNEGDGCDTNDTVISNIKLNINDGTESGSTISNVGLYNFYTQAGSFTITPDFDSDLFTITPPFAEVNFTIVDSLVSTQNFCLTPNGNHPDLDIVIVPFGARPGFDANYKIIYRNKGNHMLSGSIVLAYQEDVLDFVSANPSESSSVPGLLTWNYNNLPPFEQREIYVTFNVNGPMETPPVNIDDVLAFSASISPSANDETPVDNTFAINQVVVGSLDPNDITCLEGNSVNPDKIGEYLHYNINFENTGTAPATFIVVKDIIDVAQFDMSTLQLLNASHPVQAKVTGNKVEFRFDAINLDPEEKGNVTFKIKTLNTLQANDDVTQHADIFFDYNWPISTNDATTVFEVLSRGDFEKDNSVKVYPNPSNGIVNISAASLIKSIELYDVQGRLLQAGSNTSLDISGRASGIYFIKVFTENGLKVEKIVKK